MKNTTKHVIQQKALIRAIKQYEKVRAYDEDVSSRQAAFYINSAYKTWLKKLSIKK